MPRLKLIDSNGRAFEVHYRGGTDRRKQTIDDFDITSAKYEDGTDVLDSELEKIETENEDEIYEALYQMEVDDNCYGYVYERNDPDNGY